MTTEASTLAASIARYMASRPRLVRWAEAARGRRYATTGFADRPVPLIIVAHHFRDALRAQDVALAVSREWMEAPPATREPYDGILFQAPELIVVQLRRQNACGCLAHRHVGVNEKPFAEPHEAFGGARVGEMDIAWKRVENWLALPLTDTALDVKFLEGSRLAEFRARQFRLKLLSILLHETNHLVSPNEPESSVRERSLAFYRAALAHYVESTLQTLSLTIDRSFSRFG